ncbi:MAG: glycerate kinase, partial [Opitutaceae bacterium]
RIPVPARARLGAKGVSRVAVVEMAAASGLALLDPGRRDPWHATSGGTGDLLRAAADHGADLLLLGIGGSATNDLGLGALAALGWRFLAGTGAEIHPPIPRRWPEIRRIEGGPPPGFPPLRIACDVSNPLLGPDGAATIYGPQKGLRPEDLDRLEAETARLARMLCANAGRSEALMGSPGSGAAGGIGFGLMAALGAPLISGSALIADWLELDRRVRNADVVLTGEGRFDESSLSGKGPGAVVERAVALRRPVHVLAGQIRIPDTRMPDGARLHAIATEATPLAAALRDAGRCLVLSVGAIAQKLAGPP